MIDITKLYKILEAKEARANRQQELILKYNSPIISFSLNVPGGNKNKYIYITAHKIGIEAIENSLKKNKIELVHFEQRFSEAGTEAFFVCNARATTVKNIAIDIEESHTLGRLFDIDVFDEKFNQVSRRNVGRSSRKCLICSREASICIRLRNHSFKELISKVEEIIKSYN